MLELQYSRTLFKIKPAPLATSNVLTKMFSFLAKMQNTSTRNFKNFDVLGNLFVYISRAFAKV
jgi:hypothetical protein